LGMRPNASPPAPRAPTKADRWHVTRLRRGGHRLHNRLAARVKRPPRRLDGGTPGRHSKRGELADSHPFPGCHNWLGGAVKPWSPCDADR
jgi:hypothetical protein